MWKLLFLIAASIAPFGDSIKCIVGYGQRGLSYSNGISWERDCPNTKYCFEVVTNKMNNVARLFDYPWDSYYFEYYVKSCGGDYGTKVDFHPYRGKPKILRSNPRLISINLTTPHSIIGTGGSAQFELNYICRRDLCSDGNLVRINRSFAFISTIAVALLLCFVF